MVNLYLPPAGSTVSNGAATRVNRFDPDTNIPPPSGSLANVFNGIIYSTSTTTPATTIPGGNDPILSDVIAADDDFVAMSARTTVTVPAFPTTGPYAVNTNSVPNRWTIGVHSSDGFMLRVWDASSSGFGTGTPVNWIKSYQGGRGDATNGGGVIPSAVTTTALGIPNCTSSGLTDDSDTRCVIDLVPGNRYDIELVSFENTGNAFWEVYAAHGDYSHDNEAQWLPVGGPTTGVTYAGPIQSRRLVLTGNATAQNSTAWSGASIAAARSATYGGTTLFPPTVNLYDDTGTPLTPGRPTYELLPFPVDFPSTTGNVDRFYTKVTGDFSVTPDNKGGNTYQTFTFALIGDDGMQLRVIGEDFLSAFAGTTTATTPTLVDVNGDMALTGDGITSFNGVLGHIQLLEGQTYNFEAFHYENVGEAGMAIMFAEGALTAWDPFRFFPLSRNTVTYNRENYLNANISLFSCPRPCDFNADGLCDINDVNNLTTAIASLNNDPIFDLNADGLVDLADLETWLADAGAENLPSGNPYLFGDANLDGIVDGSDFGIWNGNKFTNSSAWSRGDLNADGIVDGSDFNIWNSHKFTSADRWHAVPEPTGLAGLLSLAVGAILRHRSQRLDRVRGRVRHVG